MSKTMDYKISSSSKKYSLAAFLFWVLLFFYNTYVNAQELNPRYYDTGVPVLHDIWVDPILGDDNNNGSTRGSAYLTLAAAWASLPNQTSSTGFRISLVAGDYTYRDLGTNDIVGLYLDERHGTYNFPIIIEATDGLQSAHIYSSLDFRDVSYVYLIGLDFKTDLSSYGGGNTVHFADGDHILIRNCKIDGFDGTTRKPQETLKVNQVQNIFVEDSDISGAFWFALDYVGVQYGHIQGCKIHDAGEDCLLLKGGSAQIRVESNFIYNADRFGFSAGQGAGFDFMVVPWLHYEAYDLKFINNVIYNTYYAGVAVLGGYNILIAYNTLYKIGIDPTGDRTLLSFNLGQRGCDGAENDTCNNHHRLGGWSPGPWSNPPLDYGVEADCIPNKNVFVYNNIFYNPGSDTTIGGHFEIRAPYHAADYSSNFLQSSNIANPALSDDNMQIRGNIIWNGSVNKLLGVDENTGAQDSNPTCNRAQLINDNFINLIEPQFADVSNLNFHPSSGSGIFSVDALSISSFNGNDKPDRPIIPTGNLSNLISRDFDGLGRTSNVVGAYSTTSSTSVQYDVKNLPEKFVLFQNYPNPFNPETTIEFQIPSTCHVTLKVFDVLGREVARLVDEEKQIGNYQVKFSGLSLSSGVFYYQLRANGLTLVKKFLLIK